MSILEQLLCKFTYVINLTDCCKCISAMMRTYDQWLRFVIGDTSDSHMTTHFLNIFVKFCTKWCILNIVDRTIKSVFSVYCHSASSCSQMWMVVDTKEQIKYTILLWCYAKKSAHCLFLSFLKLSWHSSTNASITRCIHIYSLFHRTLAFYFYATVLSSLLIADR